MKTNPPLAFLALAALCLAPLRLHADPLTRAEAIQIARAYHDFRWESTGKNALHGKDADGVDVQTPNNAPGADPDPQLWNVGETNTGVPYKWGGFDSLESFAAGVKKGKAAGDMYTPDKRRLGGDAVSSHAVGIDCSGFISRCWKLERKYSTESLPSICTRLAAITDLKPGDIMDAEGGHVILFAKWLDDEKTSAQFYESSPYSKVIASTYTMAQLKSEGFRPLRYKLIQD